MWDMVRDRRLAGLKFRRQVPIGRSIVDFVCPTARLVVERDGGVHVGGERDVERQGALEALGYRVLCFPNEDLLTRRACVLDTIRSAAALLASLAPQENAP